MRLPLQTVVSEVRNASVRSGAGWLSGVRCCVSPNCDARPEGALVDMLVVHNISLPPGVFGGTEIEAFFTNQLDINAHPFFKEIEGVKVSAHFLIRRDGEVVQFVSTEERAWHAGRSQWQGRTRCNDFSIGVELEGADDVAFEPAQYHALKHLAQALMQWYPHISVDRVVGHSDIAPGRKTDPGPAFDWSLFRDLLLR